MCKYIYVYVYVLVGIEHTFIPCCMLYFIVSPVLSPSASASHLSIETPGNRPGDELRMVHSPYYRALFGNKISNQDKNLLDEKQIGILLG